MGTKNKKTKFMDHCFRPNTSDFIYSNFGRVGMHIIVTHVLANYTIAPVMKGAFIRQIKSAFSKKARIEFNEISKIVESGFRQAVNDGKIEYIQNEPLRLLDTYEYEKG